MYFYLQAKRRGHQLPPTFVPYLLSFNGLMIRQALPLPSQPTGITIANRSLSSPIAYRAR